MPTRPASGQATAGGDGESVSALVGCLPLVNSTPAAYFFFSAIFNVGAATGVFGFSFLGFFASLLLRC